MPIPSMKGRYFDPDSAFQITAGAYDPCARGILLTFLPSPDEESVPCSITSIGTANEIRFALKVRRKDGTNDAGILTKQEVSAPPLDRFAFIVHNDTDVMEGDVLVRAEKKGDVTHVYITS